MDLKKGNENRNRKNSILPGLVDYNSTPDRTNVKNGIRIHENDMPISDPTKIPLSKSKISNKKSVNEADKKTQPKINYSKSPRLNWNRRRNIDLLNRSEDVGIFDFGKCLSTDGADDFVDLGLISESQSTNKFSISSWVNTSPSDIMIIGRESTVTNRLLITKFNDDRLYYTVANGGSSFGSVDFSPFLSMNVHVVGVFDGSGDNNSDRVKIYINGVLQSLAFSGTIPPLTSSGGGNFEINRGTAILGIGESIYNETSLYNEALTQGQVIDLYNNGNGKDAREIGVQPFAYYRYNQNNGDSILVDEIGNYDGVMNNFSSPPDYFKNW